MSETLRVLLVDDSDADVLLTTENLRHGVTSIVLATHARTAAEALALLDRETFDVCLLDYRLEGESGLDLLRTARARGYDVPVVVLTAAGAHEVDVAASDAGADDYLDKLRLSPELLEHAIRYARSHRRIFSELRAQNRELARLDREKNLLLGMAAHDLRNPIGVVQGYAEFLAAHLGDVERTEALEVLETMRRSCEHMATLIDDLLDVSAIEAGTLDLRLAQVDLAEVAREVVGQLAPVADAKHITLELVTEEIPKVALDRERFVQVLTNLVGNALKYSHAGTTVTVRISDGDRIRIAVEDHGIGIEPSFLPRMFQPFQRARRAGTSGEKSTGLGLSIVRRIVEAHGGTIGVTSQVGEGSTFTVTLPVPNALPTVA